MKTYINKLQEGDNTTQVITFIALLILGAIATVLLKANGVI